MSEQLAVRFPDELVEALDELVASKRFESRADAVRTAVVALLAELRREAEGQAIVDGYTRIPQTDEEVAIAYAAGLRSIDEEPW